MNKRPAQLVVVSVLWILMGLFMLIANVMDLMRFLTQGTVPGSSPALLIGMAVGGVIVSIAGLVATVGLLWANPAARGVLEIATWAVLAGALVNAGSMVLDAVSEIGANSAGILLAVGAVLVGIPFYALLTIILILLRGKAVRGATLPV